MTVGNRSGIVVAIPARNEAERIKACIEALAGQPDAQRHIRAAVVYVNNSSDDTAAVASSCSAPFALEVIEAEFPPDRAHIGSARRGAVEAAAGILRAHGMDDGIIAGTDADSHVAAGWLAALIAEFDRGIDAVAGAIDIEADGAGPHEGHVRRQSEVHYADLVARVYAELDPLEHDPWPNHVWAWGANLAVRSSVLEAVGGIPDVDLAEDRVLHAALERYDARIRHSVATRVWTSGRRDGRAPGGFADLLTAYETDPETLADFFLEPARQTWMRALWRGQARRLWKQEGPPALTRLASRLGTSVPPAQRFGVAWAGIEAASPFLARQRVPLAALPAEGRILENLLACRIRRDAEHRSGNPAAAAARLYRRDG